MEPYYYTKLNKQHQAVYHAMQQCLISLADEWQMPRVSGEALYNIFFQLRLDHPEIFWMIQPKSEKDIIKLRTFYARYLKFIRKCIRSLHDYMVCCLLLFRHFGIIEWFHESPPAQCFDSPIIHFFTKTRNVFPCFLTKNRNVLR